MTSSFLLNTESEGSAIRTEERIYLVTICTLSGFYSCLPQFASQQVVQNGGMKRLSMRKRFPVKANPLPCGLPNLRKSRLRMMVILHRDCFGPQFKMHMERCM